MTYTMDEINDRTGFANGDKFDDEAEVLEYFTPASQRQMFGPDAEADEDVLDEMAEQVIANRWHMK